MPSPDLIAPDIAPTAVLLNIIGGICLMLYGLRQIRRGLMRAFGGGLRKVVSSSTRNRVTGFLTGAVSGVIMQSASGVTMIMATFVGQKMLTTAAALAVVMGADVGVTLAAQLLSFDLSWVGPLLLLVGLTTFGIFERRGSIYKNVGLAIFGLGLVMFAIATIRVASVPFKESDALPYLLHPLEIDPVLTLIVAALVTWLLHSSLAFVMLVVSFAAAGAISLHLALLLVLGANIGAVLIPLMATLRDEPAAVRLPFANLMMRASMVILTLPFLQTLMPYLAQTAAVPAAQVLNFHVLFNLGVAILFLPLTDVVARVVHKLIPDHPGVEGEAKPQYLDYKQMETPVVALASAARETLRMADIVHDMLVKTKDLFNGGDPHMIRKIKEKDSIVDALHRALKHYLGRAMELSLAPSEAARHLQILNFSTTLEHIGDTIDKSMMPMAERMHKNHLKFSSEGMAEIDSLFTLVIDSMRMAQTVFMTSDQSLARKLVMDKEVVRGAERAASTAHFARLRAGVPQSVETSSVHLDLLRDLQRINGDVVTVAYPILEATGELLPNRLTAPRLTRLEPDVMG